MQYDSEAYEQTMAQDRAFERGEDTTGLVADAARAVELFGDDELERFAKEQRKQRKLSASEIFAMEERGRERTGPGEFGFPG